jgi:ABC-type sugar transport system ATPase subunit
MDPEGVGMSAEPILQARGLVKRYGHVTALDHADFNLYPGEILGVIGDNGAGKSTLIKALCGAVIPDAGEIMLAGKVVNVPRPRNSLIGRARAIFSHPRSQHDAAHCARKAVRTRIDDDSKH